LSDGLVVRQILEGDFEAVSGLLEELGRSSITPESEAATRQVFARHVADPNTASLIAERGSRPVGFLSLHFRERFNEPTRQAWIPDLIVTEDERGSGAAVMLFDRAIELARQRGCHSLTLESGYQRQRAHRFYEREGMRDAGKYFVMKLGANI
jgi:(aminoalkyl)phosphonate N-acetyltransferase